MLTPPVGIVHIDLSTPLATVGRDVGPGGLLLVFWSDGVPLDERYVDGAELPLSPAQLGTMAANAVATVVRHRIAHKVCLPPPIERVGEGLAVPASRAPLAELRATLQVDDAGLPLPTTCIVVATRDRPASLRRCLAALDRLDTTAAEIVVVDNSSGRSAEPVVAAHPTARYLHVPYGGLAVARNAGVAATEAEIVAFTDDDVEVHPRWLGALLRPFADQTVGAVTGVVLPAVLDTPAQLAFERSLRYLHKGYRPVRYDQRFLDATVHRGAPVWSIGAGANLAIRRSALTTVGGFDARLGAGAAGCSEDSELWYRLLVAGLACHYEPAAVTFHHHRAGTDAVVAQSRAYLRGHVAGLAVSYARHGHAGNLRRAFTELPRTLLREAVSDVWSGAMRRRLLLARVRGYVEGLTWLARIVLGARRSPDSVT